MTAIRKSIPIVIFISLVVLISICCGETHAKSSDKMTDYKVEGIYKDQKAYEKIKIIDPESLEVDAKDYIKFLTQAQIGDGLSIPMESEKDFAKMNEIATAKALNDNENAVQLSKAKRLYRNTIKQAKIIAKEKAKAKYYAVWHQEAINMDLPSDTDGSTKTYMDYKTVTAKGTPQYALLNSDKAYTKDGFRMYDGYYCVALGSYYSKQIGTKFYIKLSNGRTLRCILGDQKSDRHTDKKHQYARNNKDILEFIVDNIKLPGGDVSAIPGFEGSIVSIQRIVEPEIVIAGRTYAYEPDKGRVDSSKDEKDKKDKKNKKKNNNNKKKTVVNTQTNTEQEKQKKTKENTDNIQQNVDTDQTETDKTKPSEPVVDDSDGTQSDDVGHNKDKSPQPVNQTVDEDIQ